MIDFINASKKYGRKIAINNLSLQITEPGIYCLLGRNGAGKTTFLKMLAGHINASSGNVTVSGKEINTLAMPNNVYFVDPNAAHFNMKLENLFKAASDVNAAFDYEFAFKLAEQFKLDLNKRYRQLSLGMKAMVNTLIAMSSGKEILIFDEPTLGFDPIMRKKFYNLLQESYAEKKRIVIISTHIIDEIAKVAGQLLIIDKGQLILSDSINEIDEKAYCVTGVSKYVIEATKGLRILNETKAGGFLSRCIYDNRIEPSSEYSVTDLGLQDFFIGLVGDETEEF